VTPFAAIVASSPRDLAMATPVATPSRRAGICIATPLAYAKTKRQVERANSTGAALLVILDGAVTTLVNRVTGDRRDVPTATVGDELARVLVRMRASVSFGG